MSLVAVARGSGSGDSGSGDSKEAKEGHLFTSRRRSAWGGVLLERGKKITPWIGELEIYPRLSC